eukprot:4558886-Alexandrium_andersonii.AAC.1
MGSRSGQQPGGDIEQQTILGPHPLPGHLRYLCRGTPNSTDAEIQELKAQLVKRGNAGSSCD